MDRYRQLDLISITGDITKKEKNEMSHLKNKLVRIIHCSDPALLSVQLQNIKNHLVKERKKNTDDVGISKPDSLGVQVRV